MKILLITANFAPRGASPAVRTVHLTKYLATLGHSVHVLTYDEDTLTFFSPRDASLTEKVPPAVEVTRVRPGPLRRWMIRSNSRSRSTPRDVKQRGRANPLIPLLFPDPHADSIWTFFRTARRLARRLNPDAILTSAYPFSIHVVGHLLKRFGRGRFSWFADYGDPWTGSPITELPRPKWRLALDPVVERRLLSNADGVFVTTPPTQDLYERQFPFLAGRVTVAPMGFDPADFTSSKPLPRNTTLAGKVVLVHAGRLYSEARDPRPFFEALKALRATEPGLAAKLHVVLVGDVDANTQSAINETGSAGSITLIPWVTAGESLAWMATADQLVLFGNRGAMQIPGKIYQYLGARRPILMIYETEADPTVTLLRSRGAKIVANDRVVLMHTLASIARSDGHEAASTTNSDEFAWPAIAAKIAATISEASRQ